MHNNKKLEEAVNGPINDVLTTMMEFGEGDPSCDRSRVEATRLVAGILTAVKISIMQAAAMINEMELDDA